ncbi:MAG: beta-lactamase family protein [Gammaproteobacteria bacterium]|jgi:CubicO group peptidase (beta-lactamase class C family)|nr:beta-lactamase family protein [Gammaproteobacteria bacterium]
MKHQFKIIVVFICILLSNPPAYSTEDNNLSKAIDSLFDNREGRPGCAVGVINNGEYIHKRGYGLANLEHNISIDENSIFRIGSISKQFTAMAIAILEEQGLLAFDDEMQKHIPDLIDYGEKVTINQMIHHFSGLGDYEYMDYPGRFRNAVDEEFRWGNEDYLTNEEFYALIKTLPLIRKPERKFWYSNTGYALLTLVAQNVSGLSLRELAERDIFKPLAMNDSFFNDDVNLIIKNRADAYSPIKGKPGQYKINMTNLSWVGDGGVYTSLNDFIKWDQNFYDNKLGAADESLINTMEETYTETKVRKRNQKMSREQENQKTYAFAQNLAYYNGYKRWSHSGSWVGYLAHYTRFPELSFSTAVFCNTNEIDATIIADDIVDLFFEMKQEASD